MTGFKNYFERAKNNAKSLLLNVTTNRAESFNNNIAKCIGAKRIHYALRFSYEARCYMAVIQSNEGETISLIFREANVDVPYYGWKIQLDRRDEVADRNVRNIKRGYVRSRKPFLTADKDYGCLADKSENEIIKLKEQHYDKLK